MTLYTIDDLAHADTDHAVRVADRVWWVGHRQENDVFQCHVYLIEQGEQSVLIDPGPALTFQDTLRKIEEIIPFSHIRYFICHHSDPDIIGALPLIDQKVGRDDALLVTHGRTRMLVKHCGLERLPCWSVEEHDWVLPLDDRRLEFVFTPYAHFPGAICTFDPVSQVLFSSDIFGGLNAEFTLVAQDEGYSEAMRLFHEHYMPSRDILGYALRAIERHPIRLIAPQHGSIIPEALVAPMISRLKTLECGLYLIARGDTDIQRLSQINQALRDITQVLLIHRDFRDIAASLLNIAQRFLPAASLEFYARLDPQRVLHLAPDNRYSGVEAEPPAVAAQILGLDRKQWNEAYAAEGVAEFMLTEAADGSPILVLPLFALEQGIAQAVSIIHLTDPAASMDGLRQIIEQMRIPIQVAVEREVTYRQLELERQQIYQHAIHDPLTGVFTRIYMREVVQRLCDLQDRNAGYQVGALMLDIDHFKRINDDYGHNQGDTVLQQVGAEILNAVRSSDIPVRLGGEEFAVFIAGGDGVANVALFAERLRARIAALRFPEPMEGQSVTVSIGVAIRPPQESLQDLIHRADIALYRAKNSGRNRVYAADISPLPEA